MASRFELLRKLGEGGSGVVYEAHDMETQARVALKTLQRMDPDALARFKNEFRSLTDLSHPNLVHLGELICDHGLWFFTMELIEGTDFFDYVRPVAARIGGFGVRRPDVTRLRHALVQLVDALMCVHDSGRVHCDVKPSNVRVTPEGRVVLLDFGLVTNLVEERKRPSQETVLGTPIYMAPEQARGEPATPSVDWYALGVVLYEVLTGRAPLDGDPTRVVIEKQHMVPDHPVELWPDAPADLADLAMRLLHVSPESRPTGAEILAALRAGHDVAPLVSDLHSLRPLPVEELPFIGRADELAFLEEQLALASEGRPTFVYVSGESGIGKTALADHFAEHVARIERSDEHGELKQALVLRGICYERETVPYKAFDGVVDDLSSYLVELAPAPLRALLPDHTKLLTQLFPALERVPFVSDMGAVMRAPQDPKVARASAFAALREILSRIAHDRTLVIVLHDLQWTDTDSLSLLEELLTGQDAPACMLLATGRPIDQLSEELTPVLERVMTSTDGILLPLAGLSDEETSELVRGLVGVTHEDEAVGRIVREAQGHPLFAMELARQRREGRVLSEGLGFDDALHARLTSLDPDSRALLELLAVASAPIARTVLARALGLGPTELDRRLSALRVARLVRGEGKRRVQCYHDRLRRALLDRLDADVQRERHRALAGALSAQPDADAEQVAYQWQRAGDEVRAARYCAIAAEAAAHALAFNRAARLFDEALAVPSAFVPERLRELEVGRADALSCAGFAGLSAQAYLRAAGDRNDEQGRALRRRAAQLMLHSGRIREGLALSDRLLGELRMSRPKSPKRALFRLAWERARMVGFSPERIRIAEQTRPEPKLELLWAVAPSLAFVDLFAGSALQCKYVRLALESGNLPHVVRSLTVEAMSRSTIDTGQSAQVEEILRRTRELADGSSEPYLRALVWMAHGYVHWVSFRLQQSVAQLIQAEHLLREACVDVAWELTNTRVGLLNALWNAGRVAQHDELSREWLRDARDRGDRYAEAQLNAMGMAYQRALRGDDPEHAEQMLAACLEGWPDTMQLPQWGQYIGRVLVSLYADDGRAYEHLQAGWQRLRGSRLLNASYLALLSHADAGWACLDEARRRPEAARASLMQEIRQHAQALLATRRPLNEALSAQLEGQALVLAGRLDDAVECLRDAYDGFRAHRCIYQYPTALLLGHLVGGDEGRALTIRAMTWARDEGIAQPTRWLTTFVPVMRSF